MRTAIVGAGLAGLMAGRALRETSEVVVFEKGPIPGGRCATACDFGIAIDHGAQYLTSCSAKLAPYLERWQATGLIKEWTGPFVAFDDSGMRELSSGPPRYVACPGMDALGKALCHGIQLCPNSNVHQITYTNSWTLHFDSRAPESGFDQLILAVPFDVVSGLLGSDNLPSDLSDPLMVPCWATLAAFSAPLSCRFAGAFVNRGPLSWAALNNTKPDRSAANTVVLHASAAWSREHRYSSADDVTTRLLSEASRIIGLPTPAQARSVFWPKARATVPSDRGAFAHDRFPLTICGDWCNGNRVEGALLSGLAAAALTTERGQQHSVNVMS